MKGRRWGNSLHRALSLEKYKGYINRILQTFPAIKSETNPSAELFEPLSDRELEVLQLIAEGLTNQEVGEKLFLSLNTVKAHTRNIYGKLGVNNRTQAVAKVRGLGLITLD